MEELKTIRPELLTLTQEQIRILLPFLWVLAGIFLAVIASVFRKISSKWSVFILLLISCVGGMYFSYENLSIQTTKLFNGMMVVDGYGSFFNLVFLGSALFTSLASLKYLDQEKLQYTEYYVLLLFSSFGMMLMVSAVDLLVVFIALELMSLSVYVLVGFRRADRRSNEAAMKYFVLGAIASALFLYGTALIYGATGTMDIRQLTEMFKANSQVGGLLFSLGFWLVVLGFLFKVAAVPFHMWMPDVYEGAPVPVTGFMTTGLKAAAFAAFLRIFVALGYGNNLAAAAQANLHDILWICAVLTMVIGNVVALTQNNLKRMLAYSSISHTGYLLVGMISGPGSEQGYSPIMFYLLSYAAMNLGAFVVLAMISSQEDAGVNLHDISGLSRRHPWLALSMAVFMFSMAGIPPTAGFVAKYMLFYSAVQAHEIPLVVISVLCSAISVYYYLRVLVYMYMRDPAGMPQSNRISAWSALAVALMVLLILQMGVLPAQIIETAKKAMTSL